MKLDKRIIEEFEKNKRNSIKLTREQICKEIVDAIIKGDYRRQEILTNRYEINLNDLSYKLDPKY